MTKLREPVFYAIDRTTFVVDIDQQVLRQTDDRQNEISFISDMRDMGNYYTLRYDAATKRPAEPDGDQFTKTIEVPPMIQLDPEGMAAKYGFALHELQGKTDFEVIVDPYLLEARHAGILPTIELAGEKFIIDLRLQELRHAEYFFPVISLKSFDLTDDGWHYTAFYEPVIKQVVNIDPKLTEFPDGIIQIRLPNEIGLDPVATAKAYGMEERDLLRRYPIQKDLKAEIIPLSETGIPRLIRQNRDELRRQHAENLRNNKPRQRPRF